MVIFCHSLSLSLKKKNKQTNKQKQHIFSKIWYQNWILWLISIPEMYTFIHITVVIRK